MDGGKILVVGILLAILLFAAVYWYTGQGTAATQAPASGGTAKTTTTTTTTTPVKTTTEIPSTGQPGGAVTTSGAIREFTLTERDDSYYPNRIEVNKGDTVKIKLISTNADHGLSFALPDFGVNAIVGPMEETTFQFIAVESGEFEFYCSNVCGGSAGNLKGTLVVN